MLYGGNPFSDVIIIPLYLDVTSSTNSLISTIFFSSSSLMFSHVTLLSPGRSMLSDVGCGAQTQVWNRTFATLLTMTCRVHGEITLY